MDANYETLTFELRGHLRLIGLNRPEKLNAFNLTMLRELGLALKAVEDDADARVAILFPHGESLTAGLDLAEVGPHVRAGGALFEDGVDPLSLHGPKRKKPLVMVAKGHCLTIGIELLLASEIAIAEESAVFGQIEINRGIFPFGGATIRLPARAGYGNAMRWLLTGDRFGADEALRLGLVQEVTTEGRGLEKAIAIAETIASRAPLGVIATIDNTRIALEEGESAAVEALLPKARELMETEDAEEGLRSFIERREAVFKGR
ncbi:MAG: crotonase/enoyl-CoA hydratase family protein [Sandaracinaceae bacterium]|nr:crotonase/enoyl-CoA hydratase family protein [Sandaracinaceae bacterium]